MRGRLKGALVVALAVVLATPMGLGLQFGLPPDAAPPHELPPTFQYDTSGPWSRVLNEGPYGALPVEEGDFETSDGTLIHYGLWRPSNSLNEDVPVIITAGPYFGLLDYNETTPAARLGGFLIENYVPWGYAVVQASVRGTGQSGGCMELMSLREAQDIDELITFFGTREWSNGRVAVTGKSYDGGIAWAAAQFGNPFLKTIVPIASVTDQADLLLHNGTSERRGPIFHSLVYYPFGFGMTTPILLGDDENPYRTDEQKLQNVVCPEAWKGSAFGPSGYATGSTTDPASSDYWSQRAFREDVLANYTGSAFVVHGFKDFNVDAHQVVPFFNQLAGEKKLWMGMWGHHYPDRSAEQPANRLRWEFAEVLLQWFDKFLKGMVTNTGPAVELQSTSFNWRTLDAYSPTGTTEWTFYVNDAGAMSNASSPAPLQYPVVATQANMIEDWLYSCEAGAGSLTLKTAPLPNQLRFSGLAQFHATVQTLSGGNLIVTLCREKSTGENVMLTKGEMNLLYADGTRDPKRFVPGLPMTAKMELLPIDAIVPAGNRLVLRVYADSDIEPLPNPMSSATLILGGPGQESVLRLPTY